MSAPRAADIALVVAGQGWKAAKARWPEEVLTPRRLGAAIDQMKRVGIEPPREMIAAQAPAHDAGIGDWDHSYQVTTNGRASIPVAELLGAKNGQRVGVSVIDDDGVTKAVLHVII